MGFAKRQAERDWYRGWTEPDDKYTCDRHVDDEHLKTLIRDGASAKVCDYCGRRSRTDIACSIEVLVEAVASTLNAYWNHANDEGIP
jgi:hypothetical protein